MTQSWRIKPQFKLECSGETFINDEALTIQNIRPENNISYLVVTVQDYKSENYVDVFDALDVIDLSLRYGSDSWKKVFTGAVSTVQPQLSIQGEVLGVSAWGEGNALVKTACDESYGVESVDNSTVDTPKEIIEDIIDEHINKIFGAAAGANWNIGKKVDDAHAGLSITFLNSQYLNNFVNINRVCDLANAYAQGLGPAQVSTHWYVDPTPNLYFKKIDADHSDNSWDRYWGGTAGTDPGTQASSTIVVKEDMILYDFRKNVEEYANHIVLSSKFRMPSEDYWTEDNGGHALWGVTRCGKSDSATHIVGSHSLLLEPAGGGTGEAYYPSGQNAAWDLTKIGSEHTIPTLNMWIRRNQALGYVALYLHNDAANYWGLMDSLNDFISANNEWTHVSIPVGPYFNVEQAQVNKRWGIALGAPTWSGINYIRFVQPNVVTNDMFIDDLHFSGSIVREAKDTSEIAANNTYMKVIRNDTAVNDTLVAATDTGTAARLCYSELLRRSQTPIVGKIRIPMAEDMLPGQTVCIKACQKSDGTYRINSQDFRVKELTHMIVPTEKHGFQTYLNLTSDVTNTHAFAVPDQYSLLMEYAGALGHSEARDLKGGELDNLIPRLSKSY